MFIEVVVDSGRPFTTTCSLALLLSALLALFASPEYVAFHWYVPVTCRRRQGVAFGVV